LHNLYPNLVHLLLFGRAYLGSIASVVRRYA
jgi:fructosamine-3-kinase